MRYTPLIFAVLLGIASAGCSKSPETPPSPKMRPDQTIFRDQLRALDKAKTVEGTLQQGAQHTQDELDKQEAPAR